MYSLDVAPPRTHPKYTKHLNFSKIMMTEELENDAEFDFDTKEDILVQIYNAGKFARCCNAFCAALRKCHKPSEKFLIPSMINLLFLKTRELNLFIHMTQLSSHNWPNEISDELVKSLFDNPANGYGHFV